MTCVRFWHKRMTHHDYDNHIIRRAALEALLLNAGCMLGYQPAGMLQSIWVE